MVIVTLECHLDPEIGVEISRAVVESENLPLSKWVEDTFCTRE
jgi:hypothetical protein